MKAIEEVSKLFYDPRSGFNSLGKLQKKVRQAKIDIGKDEVEDWYWKQEVNQLLKQDVKVDKKYNKIKSHKPYGSVQMDVLDMSNTASANGGRRYLLTAIDVFSRYVWLKVFKRKHELYGKVREMWRDFDEPAENLTVDNEFVNNRSLAKFFKDKSVNVFVEDVDDHRKLGIINRFHRTFRTMIARMTASRGDKVWYREVDDLLESYNHSYHSGLKGIPAKVIMTGKTEEESRPPPKRLPIGTKARVRRVFKAFDKKASSERWSRKVYEIMDYDRLAYVLDNGKKKTLADLQVVGEVEAHADDRKREKDNVRVRKDRVKRVIRKEGIEEDNIVDEPRREPVEVKVEKEPKKKVKRVAKEYDDFDYEIEKIIKRKKKGGRWLYYVTWKGYDEKTWEPASSFANKQIIKDRYGKGYLA